MIKAPPKEVKFSLPPSIKEIIETQASISIYFPTHSITMEDTPPRLSDHTCPPPTYSNPFAFPKI